MQWKSEWNAPTLTGVISFGIGVGVGYGIRAYLNHREAENITDIMKRVDADKDQMELGLSEEDDHKMPLNKGNMKFVGGRVVFEDPELYDTDELEASKKAHPTSSVFDPDATEDVWDYDLEIAGRNPDNPYVIHRDEFDDEEKGYSHSTLTYYKGDDVLCDESDVPIYNAEKIAAPLLFGHGTNDPNVVYIRNERLEAEYEVMLDSGYYSVEVLGEEIENSFDNKKASLPKFKQE
jgi:hypothetical protein